MASGVRLGVVGGSGLYALPVEGAEWRAVDTPWGPPADALLHGRMGATEVVFLPRHGRGHRLAPGEIDHRANIAALKLTGVTHLLALSACGSFREAMPPGHFVVVDQYDDRTRGRATSFFGDGIVAHVAMAAPVSAVFSAVAADALAALGLPHSRGGTYLAVEGPRFSTRAESLGFRAAGADVIGMTGMPEAALAREAELPLAAIAMVTDFDAWHPHAAAVDTAQVIAVLYANADAACRLVAEVARRLPAAPPCEPAITRALDVAIVTPRDRWPAATATRLRAIAPRLFV